MTLPGEIGDDRPGRPGGGNWGGNWGGGNGNWNGGNGSWSHGNWGGGNWGDGNWGNGNWNGNNWGSGNWGNQWGNNYYNNWSNTNNNFHYFGPGWSGARWGNWYQGSWGTGLGAAWGAGLAGYWAGSLYNPGYYYNSWGYLPTAWNMPIYGSWGLGSLAYDWMNVGYVNPYVTPATQTIVVQQPIAAADDGAAPPGVEQVVAYDYAQPIDTSAAPSDQQSAELAQEIFESARGAFKSGNYGRALTLTDQALTTLPNDPVLHEFRGLVLFALKRYEESAAAEYAVLSAGPGWNWTTLAGLYNSVDDYTRQLRTLEAFAAKHPQDAAAQFLIGYHYLVQNFPEEAAQAFAKVAKLRPEDKLSAQFAKALAAERPAEKPAPGAGTAADKSSTSDAPNEPPPPPPRNLVGTWKAHPDAKVTITLTLSAQGQFSWAVSQEGRTETIEGQAGFKDNVLVLGQTNGPPLAGKITMTNRDQGFVFRPTGAPDDADGLSFERQGK